MAVFSEIPSDALFYRRSDRNHVLFVDTPRVDGHHRIFPLHYDSDILESISCGKATVDVPFKAYFTIISPTMVRERYSNPKNVDCQSGTAKSYTSEELVWTARPNE